MSNSKFEDMLNRAAALLRKAEDPAVSKQEAEAYEERAYFIMAKYGIDRAKAALLDPNAKEEPEHRAIVVSNPRAMAKIYLLNAICIPHRCALVYRTIRRGTSDGTRTVDVFGYPSDLERVMFLWNLLTMQMLVAVKNVKTAPHGVGIAAWRKSWLVGYCTRIRERLQDANRSALEDTGDTTGTELVLADRSTNVKALVSNVYTKVRKPAKIQTYTHARGEGRAAADKADLGQTRVGATQALEA